MPDFLKPIQTRIAQYGIDYETFCDWVKRFCDNSWQFDPTRPDNRIAEWEGPDGKFRKFYSGTDEDAKILNVSDMAMVCEVLAVGISDKDPISPSKIQPDIQNPLHARFIAKAFEVAQIGNFLVELLGDGINVETPVDHRVCMDTPPIAVVLDKANVRIGPKSYGSQYYINQINKHSGRFNMRDDGIPCELSALMTGEIGWLAVKAGAAGAISGGRVREILRMK